MTYIQPANKTYYIFIVKIKYTEVTNDDLCSKYFFYFFFLFPFLCILCSQRITVLVTQLSVSYQHEFSLILDLFNNFNTGESHILSCASNKIKMQTSNAKGRHVIAVEDVYKGDTLFVEKPVAFVILPPCSLSHCSHCCASISAPIP